MFCGRKLNHRTNKLYERALRIVYCDYASHYEELLKKDGTVTIHWRNLRTLAIKMYKISNDFSPISWLNHVFHRIPDQLLKWKKTQMETWNVPKNKMLISQRLKRYGVYNLLSNVVLSLSYRMI